MLVALLIKFLTLLLDMAAESVQHAIRTVGDVKHVTVITLHKHLNNNDLLYCTKKASACQFLGKNQ